MKPRIAVFCGASTGNDAVFTAAARETAAAIAAAGFDLVYGGGRIGLMGVLADAALEAGSEVIGVIPRALSHAEVAHTGITDLQIVDDMHARKARMAELSDAFVALPGGFGTMDEFCEILTWRQLGFHAKPIGLLNVGGYYDALLQLFETMHAHGFVTSANLRLVVSADRPGALIAQLAGR